MKIFALEKIETPRLIIRPIALGDEIPLNEAVNNSLELLQKWMPWAKDPSIEATRAFMQSGVCAWESARTSNLPMVVIHRKDQKIISSSGYNEQSDPKQGLYEIGYWCDVDYQGQGYVTEYVNALTQHALKELDAKTVLVKMKVNNVRSRAVAERLNFKNEGATARIGNEGGMEYFFTCSKLENLPFLKVSWVYKEEK